MGDELKRQTGKYWVLFYQPLPEAGERIAIALIFEANRGPATVEYDPTFAKLVKVFPDADPQALAFSLESLSGELRTSNQVEGVINAYGSQLAASPARRIGVPVPDGAIDMLMGRYVYPVKRKKRARSHEDKVAKEIEAFVRGNVATGIELRTSVSARDILGRRVAGTKRIALAIPSRAGWTLVDGVDLNQSSPQETASRADEISRTFWNYSRAAGDSGMRLRRVGVVLNGNSHLASNTHEAHDYALHRFQVDSDLAIDAVSAEAGQQLRNLLHAIGSD